jgi:hypothetical protein
MPDEFYNDTDWEGSSGPIISRQVAAADLWPHGANSESDGTGDKDVLEDGLHPVLAVGSKNYRPNNLIGVVMTYTNEHLVILNMADKFIVKAYVANITAYGWDNGGNPVFSATYPILAPVYVDDSPDLSAGVTLSMAPLNDLGYPNPLAGYIFYCQDQYVDNDLGGPNSEATFPITADAEALVERALCVILVNDSGQAWAYYFNRHPV